MINIRKGVFETNSSSSHSICINNQATDSVIPDFKSEIDYNGMWYIDPDDTSFYRHPFRVLTSPKEKVMYCIACCARDKNRTNLQHLEAVIHDLNHDFNHFVFPKSKYHDGYDMGGTDDSILFNWLKRNNVDLMNFIVDDKYFVICDGDEYNVFADLIRSGIVNNDLVGSKEQSYDNN